MFIRKTKVKGNATAVRIVESYRNNGKPKQRIIKYVGQSKDPEEIVMLEQMARSIMLKLDKKHFSSDKKEAIVHNISINNVAEVGRYNVGIFDIFGKIYDELGLDKLIEGTRKDEQWNHILKSLVLMRLSDPTSKRETAEVLSKDYSTKIPLEKLYRTMDRLINFTDKAKGIIRSKSQKLSGGSITCMLYDITTLYFESFNSDGFKEFGFSKDCKFKEVQIVLSLFATDEGLPLGYMLFPGNTSEGKTLIENLAQLKNEFELENIKVFADRAMFTKDNLNLMDSMGIKYVVAAKLRSMTKEMKAKITGDSDYIPFVLDKNFCWKKKYDYEGRRLIVNYSSKRARNDSAQRLRLVERLIKKEKNGKIKLSSLISNSGSKKFIKVQKDSAVMDKEKINRDSMWDGLHGVITNDKETDTCSILEGYKRLWHIEECFRISKTDLKMRPIYHWKQERIEAHILICYLSLAIGKFALRELGGEFSLRRLVKELSQVEISVLKDKGLTTGKLIALPSHVTSTQVSIYKKFNLKLKTIPWIL